MSEIVYAILGSSALSTLVTWLVARRKSKAEAVISELEAVKEAISIWRNTAEDLATEVKALREENKKLRGEVAQLRCTNGKIVRALEKITPDNMSQVIHDLKEKLKNG